MSLIVALKLLILPFEISCLISIAEADCLLAKLIKVNESNRTVILKFWFCQRPLLPVSSKLEDWFDFQPLYPLPAALQFLKDFRLPVWIKLPAGYLRQPNCLSSARAIDSRAIYVDDPGCNLSAIPRTWSALPEGWKTSMRWAAPCVCCRSFVQCIRFALVCLVVWTVKWSVYCCTIPPIGERWTPARCLPVCWPAFLFGSAAVPAPWSLLGLEVKYPPQYKGIPG